MLQKNSTKKLQAAQPAAQKPWKVPYLDMRLGYSQQREAILARINDVCSDARFILRQEVEEFEQRAAKFLGVKYAIGVGNGSDAIYFGLKAAGIAPGDEVITVAHTFVATLAAIDRCGATPVLVDIGPDFNMDPEEVAKKITTKTRGIVPVHLNGRCCNMEPIMKLAKDNGLVVVEDAAQGFGAKLNGVNAGGFGIAGAFSFHPMKVLACLGDGGLVTTNDEEVAKQIALLRNHGQENKTNLKQYGYNSRLDNLQAAILLERLTGLETALARRREVAGVYHEAFKDLAGLVCPLPPDSGPYHDIYSSYVLCHQDRDSLAAHLQQKGVEVFSHWSPPLHQQSGLNLTPVSLPMTEQLSAQVISLPVFPEITDEQVEYVIEAVSDFCGR
ncbi:MAG: DegT/DnrJ/EryC1/StrS family aminotransferase [Magnetococcales bacterium]|nr:DegT/DnrJ/EryC1/StrS family aminotransferase [Magnetococcales bacterium]